MSSPEAPVATPGEIDAVIEEPLTVDRRGEGLIVRIQVGLGGVEAKGVLCLNPGENNGLDEGGNSDAQDR